MNELENRILELINEDGEETPSFGGEDDQQSDDSSDTQQDNNQQQNQENADGQDSENNTSDGGQDSQADTNQDDTQDNEEDGGDSEKKDDSEEEKEEFSAESLDDLLKQTKTKIDIQNISSEPSTIFGSQDTKNHNQYRITLSNDKDRVQFKFWDSLNNTGSKKKPTKEQILKRFGTDIGMINDGVSREEFDKRSGYDQTDTTIAQKEYDACSGLLKKIKEKKIFDDSQIKELFRLSTEN